MATVTATAAPKTEKEFQQIRTDAQHPMICNNCFKKGYSKGVEAHSPEECKDVWRNPAHPNQFLLCVCACLDQRSK